ncbi:MAG: YaiO family outer membrane beta-barrel protein [Bacteroidota bacterium]
MKNTAGIIIIFLLLGFVHTSFAQGVDSLFQQARSCAFNGEREKAREILNRILVTSPGYSDVRILLGRTYSWDGKRNEARAEFNKVFAYDSTNAEAWSALADVELWDDKPEASLSAAENGLRFKPGNKELTVKRIKALIDMKRCGEVDQEIRKLRQTDSTCAECEALKRSAFNACADKTFSVGSNIDFFSKIYDPAIYNYIQIGYRAPKNTVIFRINQSSRFNKTGFQPELDLYPSIGKKMYGYINYGFTIYDLFPRHRLGLELYRSLPKSFEASLGLRYLSFTSSEVFIYTGSLTKYIGNFALIGRVYITPDTRSFSRSGSINVRRYFSDADTYIGLIFSAGLSPDNRALLTTSGLGTGDDRNLYFFKSQRAGLTLSKTFHVKHVILFNLDYTNQEFEFTRKEYVDIYGVSLTYRLRFK